MAKKDTRPKDFLSQSTWVPMCFCFKELLPTLATILYLFLRTAFPSASHCFIVATNIFDSFRITGEEKGREWKELTNRVKSQLYRTGDVEQDS